jgi:hypothetical protein
MGRKHARGVTFRKLGGLHSSGLHSNKDLMVLIERGSFRTSSGPARHDLRRRPVEPNLKLKFLEIRQKLSTPTGIPSNSIPLCWII